MPANNETSIREGTVTQAEICRMPATALARAIAGGTVSAADAVEACLAQIAAVDGKVNAYASVDAVGARAAAARVDAARAKGRRLGPLAGVPFSVKDLLNTKGVETAYGSHAFAGNLPARDVTAVARMRRAGAVLLGKSTTPEFGHKALTNSPRHGFTRNPWDLGRSPGGSSGGAAAAVAAGMGPVGISTDGAGSSRIPASCCGVLGLKPTLGVIPNDHAVELFSNFVNPGIAARTAADLALVLSALNGPDLGDPWSIGLRRRRYVVAANGVARVRGLRLLYVPRMGNRLVDHSVARLTEAALARLEAAGATVAVFDRDMDWGKPVAFAMMRAYQHARLKPLLERHRDKLDSTLVDAIEEGGRQDLLSVQRLPAERSELFRRVQALFTGADLLVTPTVSAPPPKFDQRQDEPITINNELAGDLRANW